MKQIQVISRSKYSSIERIFESYENAYEYYTTLNSYFPENETSITLLTQESTEGGLQW